MKKANLNNAKIYSSLINIYIGTDFRNDMKISQVVTCEHRKKGWYACRMHVY